MALDQEQRDYWNGEAGSRWVHQQEVMDRALGPLGQAAMARARPMPGERVLDIGCGCGDATLSLAASVGSSGSVTGLDISEPMLARARQRSADAPHVRFIQGDAATHVFDPGSAVDLVFSRFGVMFFAQPEAAFANIRSALKPSGRLAFVCWRPRAENPWMTLPLEAAARVVPAPPPPNPDDPGPFAFAKVDRVRRVLGSAGFADVEVAAHDHPITLGATVDEATEFAIEAGPTARLLQGAPEGSKERAREAIESVLRPLMDKDGIVLMSATWLVTARRG